MRIYVLSSDMQYAKPPSTALLWGDYWVRQEITRALQSLGVEVSDKDPDACFFQLGYDFQRLPDIYTIAWLYDHPNSAGRNPSYLQRFGKVFCLSSPFTQVLRDMGCQNVETMVGASSKTPPIERKDFGCDIALVANPRPGQGPKGTWGRRALTPLLSGDYRIKAWSGQWKSLLPEKYYGGAFFPYDDLADLYGSVKISLNDQYHEMSDQGFVPVRVFDILASGGFCISAWNAGIEDLFGDAVPQFRSPTEELDLIDYYLSHDVERECLCKLGLEKVQEHTWKRVGERIIDAVVAGKASV